MSNIMESPEIVAAIEECTAINEGRTNSLYNGRQWAKLFIYHDKNSYHRRVEVSVGMKGEIASHTIHYGLALRGGVCKFTTPAL